MINKGTWKAVDRAIAQILKSIPTQVVMKIKRYKEGTAVKFKARVVAGRNFQIPEEHFDGVYAPFIDVTLTFSTR